MLPRALRQHRRLFPNIDLSLGQLVHPSVRGILCRFRMRTTMKSSLCALLLSLSSRPSFCRSWPAAVRARKLCRRPADYPAETRREQKQGSGPEPKFHVTLTPVKERPIMKFDPICRLCGSFFDSCRIPALAADAPLLTPQTPIVVPGGPGGFDYMQIDSAEHRLYASHPGKSTLVVLDLNTNAVQQIPTGSKINGIAVDDADNKLFTAGGGGKVVVFDNTTLAKTAEITLSGPGDDIVLDPKTDQALCLPRRRDRRLGLRRQRPTRCSGRSRWPVRRNMSCTMQARTACTRTSSPRMSCK